MKQQKKNLSEGPIEVAATRQQKLEALEAEVERAHNASIQYAAEGLSWYVCHLLSLEAPEAILLALAEGAEMHQRGVERGQDQPLRKRARGRLDDIENYALEYGQVHLNRAAKFLRDEAQLPRASQIEMLNRNLMTEEERKHGSVTR